MGPGRAILMCVLKTGQTWGRATRSEFWWFAPAGAVPPFLVGYHRTWWAFGWESAATIALVGLATLPLLSAAARRLQDTGEQGLQAFAPIQVLAAAWVGLHGFLWLTMLTFNFVGLLIFAFIGLPAVLVAMTASVVTAAQVLGMLLIPPDRAPNRFGPDPRASW